MYSDSFVLAVYDAWCVEGAEVEMTTMACFVAYTEFKLQSMGQGRRVGHIQNSNKNVSVSIPEPSSAFICHCEVGSQKKAFKPE